MKPWRDGIRRLRPQPVAGEIQFGRPGGTSREILCRQVHFSDHQQSDRGRGRGRRGFVDFRGTRGRGGVSRRCELTPLIPSSPYSCSQFPESVKVGARLLDFAHVWATVTDDPWVLNTVKNGLVINFLSQPAQNFLPHDVVMSDEMQSVCNSELSSLLKKGGSYGTNRWIRRFRVFFLLCPKEKRGF